MAITTTQDLRQQVGQLLILGYDGLAVDSKLRTTLEHAATQRRYSVRAQH